MSNEGKKVSWNVSEGLIMEISNRRSLANTYFIQGNIKKALSTLISIKQSVIQSFTTEQRKKLTAIEDKFNRISFALSKSTANSFNTKTNEAYKEAMNLAKKFYSEYNDKLMDLLEEYNYLIGEKSDSSKMNF
jgi:hypothetical protein